MPGRRPRQGKFCSQGPALEHSNVGDDRIGNSTGHFPARAPDNGGLVVGFDRHRNFHRRARRAGRRRLSRLGGEYIGLDQSQGGARDGFQGVCMAWRRRFLDRHLCGASCRALHRGGGAQSRRQAVRGRLHGDVRAGLCELDRGQLRLCGRGDTGRSAEIRHRLVVEIDQ